MKYLIIGGTGLISTPISTFLLERGENVTLYNRGKTSQRIPSGAKTIIGDRRNFDTFKRQMADAGKFDFVIDMVCYTPDEAETTIEVFNGRIDQLIFCSTVDVYAKPANRLPYTESEPRYGITDYARNKILCEDIIMRAHNHNYFKTTIIRPAATYGEGGVIINPFGWKTTYLDRIRKGKPLIVPGNGNSLWVMCHVHDVARALLSACGNPKAYGRAYHTAGEEWLTWNRYHEIVAEVMGAPKPKFVHIPIEDLYQIAPWAASISMFNFQYNNIFDNSNAHVDLDFKYTIPFKEGARRTIEWLESHEKIENSDQDPFDDRIITVWNHINMMWQHELKDLDKA
jgi:nucleoside-diphosphate-sugar epimerase